MTSEGGRGEITHTPDMLYGLAERLSLLALQYPKAYSDAYTSVMHIIEQKENPGMRNRNRGKMTQADKILFLLRKGHRLTKMELSIHHKIATPTARITELRQRGHNIKAQWKTCPVDGSEYVEYYLNEDDKVPA